MISPKANDPKRPRGACQLLKDASHAAVIEITAGSPVNREIQSRKPEFLVALFRLPKFTEYALRSLACLARNQQRMSVREIARQEQLHPASLAKIMHRLCWHGLVHSVRGRQGGFWLARDATHIPLKEVVEIFQGPFESPEAAAEPGFPAAWESLYAPTRQALEKLTLADLLRFNSSRELADSVAPIAQGPPPQKSYLRGGGS